jgi:MULE transposase domain
LRWSGSCGIDDIKAWQKSITACMSGDSQLENEPDQSLLTRYEELVTIHIIDRERLRSLVQKQGHLILAVDGLKPDVGHEVLWVVRDCASGEILLARPLLSERESDLVTLLKEVLDALSVPVHGVISDGQHSIRNAVATAFPGIPHQLCHFH